MTNAYDAVIVDPITAIESPIPSNPLAKLSAAKYALEQAKDLTEVKQIIDIAEAARVYARAAKLGLEAANHAAEIKILAEYKAGELLQQLERAPHDRGNQHVAKFQPGIQPESEYRAVLTDSDIAPTTAHRWQTLASVPKATVTEFIERVKQSQTELTSASVRRLAETHVSFNSGENEWYTPAEYIDAAREVMGCIDLDPASSPQANSIVRATTYYTVETDGLSNSWAGNTWMNPPYSSELIGKFVSKLIHHVRQLDIRQAIVLVNNATETGWFGELVTEASAVVFTRGRVRFWCPGGKQGAPLQGQAIVYIGPHDIKFLSVFGRFGWGARCEDYAG